jgi:serine/threonine protein kinase
MSIEDYNLIKVLGRGAFGKVKKKKKKKKIFLKYLYSKMEKKFYFYL